MHLYALAFISASMVGILSWTSEKYINDLDKVLASGWSYCYGGVIGLFGIFFYYLTTNYTKLDVHVTNPVLGAILTGMGTRAVLGFDVIKLPIEWQGRKIPVGLSLILVFVDIMFSNQVRNDIFRSRTRSVRKFTVDISEENFTKFQEYLKRRVEFDLASVKPEVDVSDVLRLLSESKEVLDAADVVYKYGGARFLMTLVEDFKARNPTR